MFTNSEQKVICRLHVHVEIVVTVVPFRRYSPLGKVEIATVWKFRGRGLHLNDTSLITSFDATLIKTGYRVALMPLLRKVLPYPFW